MNLLEFTQSAIGTPFKDQGRDAAGWDCWGLVYCLYRQVFGVELPSYLVDVNRRVTVPLMRREQENYQEIPLGQEAPGDMIVLRPCHVGVVVDRGRMLHAHRGAATCLESYIGVNWRSRIVGIYRDNRAGSSA